MADEQNKVLFGLSDVAVAFKTSDGWDAPTKIPGAVNLSTDAEGDQSVFYADNIAYYTANSNAGYSGDLEIANIPDALMAKMLGWKVDKSGALVEIADGVPTPFALLFSVSGDKAKRRAVMYNVTASRPSDEWATTEDKTDVTALKLPYTATPIEVGENKIVKAAIEPTTANKEKYDAWYTKVFEPDFTSASA